MSYKIKSLLYFSCFVIAATIYYVAEQHDNFQDRLTSKDFVEVEYQDELDSESQDKGSDETKR